MIVSSFYTLKILRVIIKIAICRNCSAIVYRATQLIYNMLANRLKIFKQI